MKHINSGTRRLYDDCFIPFKYIMLIYIYILTTLKYIHLKHYTDCIPKKWYSKRNFFFDMIFFSKCLRIKNHIKVLLIALYVAF